MTTNKPENQEPVTLILQGGGIRFPIFIGALQAIEEKGLNIRKVVGSSSGSIIGALYAAGLSTADMQKETLVLDPNRFRDFSLKTFVKDKGLYAGKVLEAWLDDKLSGKKFGDTFRFPIHIVATDILNFKPVIFSSRNYPEVKVSAAARFSTGVPLVFAYRHFEHGGKKHIFIDGSLMSGMTEETFSRKEKTLILKVISKRTLNHPTTGTLSLKNYLKELLTFSIHSLEKEYIKGGKWKDTILLYCADISPAKFTLTESEKRYLFEQGYEQTMKYLSYKWGM